MRLIKNIKKGILFLIVSSAITSCSDDFLDVNTNPNDPSFSTPSLTLPVAQQSLLALNSRSMNYLGNFMTYSWSTPSNWSANSNLIRYNVTTTFYANIFETSYSQIFKDLVYVNNYDDGGQNDYSAYKSITTILKSFQYQYLVDLYGDVPYSEANMRELNLTPKYDDAETIYKSVIDELTAAASLASNMPSVYLDPGSQDIIFGGNMDKWAAFANTIKLRMLIRLSNTGQDSYIASEITKINANGAGYITETVVGQPGYSDDTDKQNPFWGYIGSNPNGGEITNRNDYTIATDYIIDLLSLNNDDRMERLFAEAHNGGYLGAEQSTILPGTGFTNDDTSHVGPGLLIGPDQDQPLMLLSEAQFLQAEAMVRNYITGGDAGAQAMYESAIENSFKYLGVEDASDKANDYYSQPIANINWGSSSNKIQAIITQKWLALLGTNGIEPWIELTRTGYPTGLPIPAESNGVRPVRLLYPASEVSRNSNNVPSQTQSDAFTSNPFWK